MAAGLIRHVVVRHLLLHTIKKCRDTDLQCMTSANCRDHVTNLDEIEQMVLAAVLRLEHEDMTMALRNSNNAVPQTHSEVCMEWLQRWRPRGTPSHGNGSNGACDSLEQYRIRSCRGTPIHGMPGRQTKCIKCISNYVKKPKTHHLPDHTRDAGLAALHLSCNLASNHFKLVPHCRTPVQVVQLVPHCRTPVQMVPGRHSMGAYLPSICTMHSLCPSAHVTLVLLLWLQVAIWPAMTLVPCCRTPVQVVPGSHSR